MSLNQEFRNKQQYQLYLETLGGFPEGFVSSSVSLEFVPPERNQRYEMNLALVKSEKPCNSFAALFTQNAICGVPIIIARSRLERSSMQGIFVNNRVANVANVGGMESAKIICNEIARCFDMDSEGIFPCSTGIIGWQLPVKEIIEAIPRLQPCSPENSALVAFAKAIMTTDSYPKIARRSLGNGKIVGVAKGAGMIEPNMATMLVYIFTDLDIPRKDLQQCLNKSVGQSFNRITVDGDQSTSDMVIALSSQKYTAPLAEFESALCDICKELSEAIIRNAEGTGHVIRITLSGHSNEILCASLAKAVANSPLVKTAIYGNDPNVGRILSAIGDAAGTLNYALDPSLLTIKIANETVFHNSTFTLDEKKEVILSQYLREQSQDPTIKGYPQNNRAVEMYIDLGECRTAETYTVLTSDLGKEYVIENAEYRT